MTETPRRHPRVEVRLGAEIQVRGEVFTAITKNISAGGAALETERMLHDGEALGLSLYLVYDGIEDERMPPLAVGARVQWTAESDDGAHSAGVQFEGITEAQTSWLTRVIKLTEGEQAAQA